MGSQEAGACPADDSCHAPERLSPHMRVGICGIPDINALSPLEEGILVRV